MRIRKLACILLAVLLLLPGLILALLNTPPGRSAFSSLASRRLGREVQFNGHVYPAAVWPPALHVSRLTVANREDGKAPHMVDIGTMTVALSTRALSHGKLRIRQLSLVDSAIHLERDAKGNANWTFSSAPQSGGNPILSLGRLYFENSVITYLDVPEKTDFSLNASTQGDSFFFTGDGMDLGKPFSLKGSASASCLAHHARACPLEVLFSVGHTALQAKGTLMELMPPEGADFMLDIKGADAAELFPLFGIATPMTPPYHLAGHLTYENERWHFDDFSGTVGESDLHGSIVWDTSEDQPKLTAKLISQKLRFADLGPLIGLAPAKRVSEQQKELAARQEASPYVIPDVPLDINRVSAMDADVEFTGKQVISESMPLDDFYMKLSLDARLMKLMPVRFGTASGNISANMVIDARQSPVVNHADIQFNHLSLARLLRDAGRSLGDIEQPTGDIGGTMTLAGPGNSLHSMLGQAHGVSGFGMLGGSISNLLVKLLSLDVVKSLGFLVTGDKPLAIRCFVAGFDVDHGMMKASNVVFDTADTNITAEGSINLRTEALALHVLPAPKNATLLSLRSPIDIGGTIKHPDVSIEKGSLAARGGIATGLATLAPVAAVLAFVEPGMGKDSDCHALIDQMNARTGKTPQTDEVPKNP